MASFPIVPNVPGVPPLLQAVGSVIAPLALLVGDVIGTFSGIQLERWGLFFNGIPAFDYDSVVSFDYKQSWAVSTYPVEEGAFETYDKVEQPFDVKMRLVASGSEARRQALVDSIDAIADNLDLLDAVTPEKVYPSVNISHYDYRRTSVNGAGLIIIDVWCIEIRVNQQVGFFNTQSPSGADAVQTGNIQTTTPTGDELTKFLGF